MWHVTWKSSKRHRHLCQQWMEWTEADTEGITLQGFPQ